MPASVYWSPQDDSANPYSHFGQDAHASVSGLGGTGYTGLDCAYLDMSAAKASTRFSHWAGAQYNGGTYVKVTGSNALPWLLTGCTAKMMAMYVRQCGCRASVVLVRISSAWLLENVLHGPPEFACWTLVATAASAVRRQQLHLLPCTSAAALPQSRRARRRPRPRRRPRRRPRPLQTSFG
jgi:hypothetical protein